MIRLAAALWVAASVFASEFSERRARLKDTTLVVLGLPLADGETRDGYFQDPSFFYLTGIRDPGGALIVRGGESTIYLPRRDAKAESWHGRMLAFEDQPALDATLKPWEEFEADAAKLEGPVATPARSVELLKKLAPQAEIRDAAETMARLRNVKSASELAAIGRAIEATIAAHRTAWRTARPGLFEYELAESMTGIYRRRGCERHAYPPIVGSGPNGLILHYFRNNRRMDSGELVLMDVGAECSGYAADITRTIPVTGKFTPRQREIYQAVLKAERAVIAAAKPGVTMAQLKQIAVDSLNDREEPLGEYLIHGVAHHVGLEVHDAEIKGEPVVAGSVITIEPGVYLPKENMGIRIEDMVLITESGARVLTASLPVEVEEIEREMARLAPTPSAP
jgi:Xaa-Pro aminopeptidase